MSDDLDIMDGSVIDGNLQLNNASSGSNNLENGLAFSEEFLLDDFESYYDDVSAHLTILRIVNGSIIKGVIEEASEKITLKDKEIASLNMRLQFQMNQFQEENLREENSVLAPESLSRIFDEFKNKLYAQISYMNTFNKSWQRRFSELYSIHEELELISKLLISHEVLFSYNSLDSSEECETNKRKDSIHGEFLGSYYGSSALLSEEVDSHSTDGSEASDRPSSEIVDSSQAKYSSKEDLVPFYESEIRNLKKEHKSELTKLKRQHESALQEKTEELFSLKRDFLKEKGSPLHLKRDKVIKHLRKKILELISKFDHILFENGRPLSGRSDYDTLYHFKDQMTCLLYESDRLQRSLAGFKVHSSLKEDCLTRKFEFDMKDAEMEVAVRDEVHHTILRDFTHDWGCELESGKLDSIFMQDIYSHIYRGIMHDVVSSVKSFTKESYEEKESIRILALEKEKVLLMEREQNEKLKQANDLLLKSIRQKDKAVLQMESNLLQQKEHFNVAYEELKMLKDLDSKHALLISESKKEADATRSRLDEALQQVLIYQDEVNTLHQKIKALSETLGESEKQKVMLQDVIQEKELTSSVTSARECEGIIKMQCLAVSIVEFSKVIAECEGQLVKKVDRNLLRLDKLDHGYQQLVQQASMLKRKALWYKQVFEIRCSDLQKAETEVDLLGDEVDVLTKLLQKIYIALDFYSPVLQHYPGVMEVLKLLRRELGRQSLDSS